MAFPFIGALVVVVGQGAGLNSMRELYIFSVSDCLHYCGGLLMFWISGFFIVWALLTHCCLVIIYIYGIPKQVQDYAEDNLVYANLHAVLRRLECSCGPQWVMCSAISLPFASSSLVLETCHIYY